MTTTGKTATAAPEPDMSEQHRLLVDDPTWWDMPTIAKELRVQYQAVQNWRRKSRLAAEENGQPDPALMPPPLPGTLVWTAGSIRKWAMATGRMAEDGTPTRVQPAAPQTPNMTYLELVSDYTEWDLPAISLNLNVQRQTVKSWRRDSLVEQRAAEEEQDAEEDENARVPLHPNRLPPPHRYVFGKPVWRAGLVRLWAMQTGRMLPDGTPVRSKPPGRPRRQAA